MMTAMPEPIYERAPCPTCGAMTELDAIEMCRPSSDETGERFCAGEFDAAGNSVRPTQGYLAALDAWCSAQFGKDAR